MHDGMQYNPIQGQGQGHEPSFHFQTLSPPPFTTGAGNRPLILKLKYDIFVLLFVSRDFELGRNVSGEESTVSPVRG